jgi:NTE family protein
VIDVLAQHAIPIDTVAGTSIGAAVAVLVGMGEDGDAVLSALEVAGRLTTRPTLSRSSLFSTRRLARHFADVVGDVRLEDLAIPTAAVATDMDSGEEVVFRRGLARLAVMASIAIPGVYPPQYVSGRRLIDGAYVNPVPANVAGSLGADIVIAVKLATRARGCVELEAVAGTARSPWIPQVILRSVDAMSNTVARALPGQASVVIEPSFQGAGGSLSDFRRGGERFRAEGRRATEAIVADLATLLPWVSPG